MDAIKSIAAVMFLLSLAAFAVYGVTRADAAYKSMLQKCESSGGVYLHKEAKCVKLEVIPLK